MPTLFVMTNHYDWLINRLDAFIRKYYANQVLRGSLVLLSCVLAYVLLVSVGEYYLYLPVWAKVTIVSLFALLGGGAFIVWILIPLSRMARLGRIISHEQAALIVGQHFPEISDKLLNILQLKKQADAAVSRELVEASINQKAAQLSVIPITNAVDLRSNRKYLKYLIPIAAVGGLVLLFSPSVFTDASERLLQPTKPFSKPAPFRFVIDVERLRVVRHEDFVLNLQMAGSALPANVQLVIGSETFPMSALGNGKFRYTLRNVTEPVQFQFSASGFYSEPYTLKVVQKPVLKAFRVQLDYPDYTGRKDETRNSLSDMTVPAGTNVRWGFVAEHTDAATIRFGNGPEQSLPSGAMMFAYSARFFSDTTYEIALINKASGITERYPYQVQVVPDQHPTLQVQEVRDTVTGRQILLTGNAGDDYGISRVLFHYQITGEQNKTLLAKSIPLKVNAGSFVPFQHYFDIDVLKLQPGQKISYFLEAWDNDAVNGSKAIRSEVMMYTMFNASQLDSAINANAAQINSGLSNSSKQTRQMQQQFKDMQSKMLQSDKLDWEQQQSLQGLAEQQEQMQKQVEEIKKRFDEQVQQSKQKEYSEEVRDKQDALKEQMENLLNNELKEQMKKLQELMAKMNKENAFKTMQQLEQDNKLFNMDLQRMQELMKNLEMQMRMEDMANKMDDLARKQMELKKETDAGKKQASELSKKQDQLQQELSKTLKEDGKEMQQLNDKLLSPQDMAKVEEEAKDAQENMEQSEQDLNQNQNSKSSQSQQKAAQNLQNMAQSLRSMAGGMDMEQIDMDIRAVRQILSNLMRLSFDQEQLMNRLRTTSPASPQYLNVQKEQGRLHSNSLMIRDSLFVLSKRLFKLAASVNKETTEMENNMKLSREAIEGRQIAEAAARQQFVMMRANNLALMLNEMLSNLMQMQSQAQSQQKGNCQKPGGTKPKPGAGQQLSDIISKQQQLGNSMQQMQQAQQQRQGQQGSKEGKDGKSGSEAGDNASEQLARMAAQQAAIRRQLQQLQSILNSKGIGNSRELRELQEKMDRNETDIVNKRLTSELLIRQKEILTRLLETEKAIREQEEDDKRSSKKPQDIARPIPPALQQYLKDKQVQTELYKTIPPQLKPYFKGMVDDYYRLLGNRSN